MNQIPEVSSVRLSERRLHGRVANAIAHWLDRTLSVPEVYLGARIGTVKVDVLAVDQAGSGDAHGVEIKVPAVSPTEPQLRKLLMQYKAALPLHFRYLAIQASDQTLSILAKLRESEALFDASGIGRVGVLAFDQELLQTSSETDNPAVQMVIKPERFRVRGEAFMALERYIARNKPDMQVRI